jgi:hypothetical protein
VLTDSARELYERRYIQSMRNALIGHPEGPTAQQRLALTNVTTGQGRIAATIAAFRNAMTASSVPVDGLSLAKGGYVMEVECDEKAQRRMAYAAPKPGETP